VRNFPQLSGRKVKEAIFLKENRNEKIKIHQMIRKFLRESKNAHMTMDFVFIHLKIRFPRAQLFDSLSCDSLSFSVLYEMHTDVNFIFIYIKKQIFL
jgi:hypothetical protein